jgi:hypothetical protein
MIKMVMMGGRANRKSLWFGGNSGCSSLILGHDKDGDDGSESQQKEPVVWRELRMFQSDPGP